MGKRVLLVDDDQKLLKLVKEYLEGYGFPVLTLPDGSAVMKTIAEQSPDIIILDIMLPGKDGLDILKEIRAQYALPVIMLTAKGEDADRIVGLELGADDYLPKPFNPRELLARVKAVLRRPPSLEEEEGTEDKRMFIKVGGLALNVARQTLVVEDREVDLSTTEYKVLEALMKHPNTVMTRDQLMDLARGRDFVAFDRSIDVHVSKLRAKLAHFPNYKDCIKTVWGTGYMFVETP
jgi:two-component system phosphate regulon response regulator OmpR